MNLICMAHKGEAQSFLKSHFNFTQKENMFYISKDKTYSLLITGEGILEVLPKLAFVLGRYNNIESITNLGIAGCLNEHIQIGEILSITKVSSYAETHLRKEIYEISSDAHTKRTLSCVTADKRILTSDDAKALAPYAEVVDREAWAIARVAAIYKKRFNCYKYISDRAGIDTQNLNFKQLSKTYSDALLQFHTTSRI